jgi:hypothetical protein
MRDLRFAALSGPFKRQRNGSMRLTVEHGVFLTGVLLACASASFAAHRIATNTGVPSVQPILPPGELMAWKRGIVPAQDREPDLDPTTTGSIPASSPRSVDASDLAPTESVSQDYVLIDIAEDGAVVQGPAGTRRVRVGTVLPGIGRITGIHRIGSEWVIATSASVIRARR